MAKRVLMVLTNHAAVEETGACTGWYLPELAHPLAKFVEAGWSCDFASITGGLTTVAESSIDLTDEVNKKFWEDAAMVELTKTTAKLSEVDATSYDVLFFVGGFGTMWDFPFSEDVNAATRAVYEKGGTVGAVCHGPIALANVKLSDGSYLVAGKEVAGFCNEEEEAIGLLAYLPAHADAGDSKSCEDVLLARGALYKKTAAWGSFVCSAERLFTGQNPASASAVGEAIVASF
mmetsp:Transcript_5797/g.12767  ORF Transcript_5797/g.12767 Transcript_5797/m.12767 type:complete len:233 (-) Transcript_5797:84-782(-)|eukprot:CAMPEP_0173169364 /NCGR_PEP_ID=MMETSP1141-20130122/665_1 /TAXON_ID=483371 /ORGANISM="non described non described, Strain CCMP2298" /LENGTH=232 /DNA_ID=CAMNT_0014091187 /DNA_START=57 /DNA_END=755 /DNA_ORIENTATION=+